MSDFIGIYDNALSTDFCRGAIQFFESHPEIHSDGAIGGGIDKQKKDSLDTCISDYHEWAGHCQGVFQTLIENLTAYVREFPYLVCGALSPTVQLETGKVMELSAGNLDQVDDAMLGRIVTQIYRPGRLNLQKYFAGTGGFHHWHSEIYPKEPDCETLHRVLLFMFFLNDVEEGGETEFLYQEKKISPKTGRMVIAPAGFTHTHKGHVPVTQDKYIITSWVLFQRAETLYPVANA